MGCTKSTNNLFEDEENDSEYDDTLQRGSDIYYKDKQEEEKFKDFEEIGSKF